MIVNRHHAAPDQVFQGASHGVFVKAGVAGNRFGLAPAFPRQGRENLSLNQIRGSVLV